METHCEASTLSPHHEQAVAIVEEVPVGGAVCLQTLLVAPKSFHLIDLSSEIYVFDN